MSEEECDAAEADLAANPPQINGHLLDGLEHLLALAEQIATRAKGAGNGAADAAMDLTKAATTLLNLVDDLARHAPQTSRQWQIYHEFLARLTRALVSRRKALLASNVAYPDKIKALFSEKDLLRRSDSTRLVQKAIRHYSRVYELIASPGRPSSDEQLVLKYEKFFRGNPYRKMKLNACSMR